MLPKFKGCLLRPCLLARRLLPSGAKSTFPPAGCGELRIWSETLPGSSGVAAIFAPVFAPVYLSFLSPSRWRGAAPKPPVSAATPTPIPMPATIRGRKGPIPPLPPIPLPIPPIPLRRRLRRLPPPVTRASKASRCRSRARRPTLPRLMVRPPTVRRPTVRWSTTSRPRRRERCPMRLSHRLRRVTNRHGRPMRRPHRRPQEHLRPRPRRRRGAVRGLPMPRRRAARRRLRRPALPPPILARPKFNPHAVLPRRRTSR
jgi:hypothetical protein